MNLTVKDVAKLLSTSERTVYRWIGQKTIPAYRVNDQYRFNRAELLEWATSRRLNVSPELLKEPETNGGSLKSLGEGLRAGGIYYRLGGSDTASVLRHLIEQVRLPDDVDRAWLYEMLLARESLGSTAIGDGVAIPHVRYPIVLNSDQVMVSLCFLENPVDFGALDGRPVSTLFTVVSPSIRAHLHILAHIGFALRDEGVKGVLARTASREEILGAVDLVEAGIRIASQPRADAGR